MKWLFFAFCLAVILPYSAWLRRNPGNFRLTWVIFGFMPFGLAAIPQLDIALIDWATWPGYVRGMLFSAQDALALAVLLALPRSERSVPFLPPMLLYFCAVVLSVFQAPVEMAALFYPWQLLRAFLIYFVVARASADRDMIPLLLTGLAIGLCVQTGIALYQRYGLGMLQTAGSFEHQNQLGLVSNFVAVPLFALLLAGRTGWLTLVAPLAACVTAVLTTSRATIGLAAAGLALVFAVSVLRQMTPRKAAIGLAGGIVLAALSPIAIASFEKRFAEWPLSESYDERAAFNEAASLILEDHPLGIGVNNYVVVANTGGYLQRAGVAVRAASRSTPVHNTYWLTAAETGYFGLAAFLFLLFRPLKAALTCGWRHRDDRRGDLLLGLGISLLIVYVHACFEWIFFLSPVPFFFAMVLGMIAGLTQQLGYWGEAQAQNPAPSWSPESVGDTPSHKSADANPMEQDEKFWGMHVRDGEGYKSPGH